MTVGIYAQDTDDEESQEMFKALLNIIKDYEHIIQVHGFYINREYNIVSFDIVLTFEDKDPEGTAESVRQKVKELYPQYNYICNIDYDY